MPEQILINNAWRYGADLPRFGLLPDTSGEKGMGWCPMKILVAVFSLLLSIAAYAAGNGQGSAPAWQAQFGSGTKWSTLGVADDSGRTDNTRALNALPANTPIIGDCPNGGFVQFSGTWSWRSGLTVWQQPGCYLKSTITTPGVYPIANPGGLSAKSPISNVQYYGMNFSFVTPTNQVRVMALWVNHFKFENFIINGSGGFAYLRGSDQEVTIGLMTNTDTSPGSPGVRHFGNVPKVAKSAGMPANVWIHNNNFQTGDSAYQACQPGSNSATWTYNVSSDDILYEDNYGSSTSSALILINEPVTPIHATHYSCNNIVYRNVSGSGLWYAIVAAGNGNSVTSNIAITDGTYDGSSSSNGIASIGVGDVTYGGQTSNSLNTRNITLSNLTLSGIWNQAVRTVGTVKGLNLSNNTVGPPRSSNLPLIEIQGTTGSIISYNELMTLGNVQSP